MLEAVLVEKLIPNDKTKVRHFRGWWGGTDRGYRNVPNASGFPRRHSAICQQVLGPIKGVYATETHKHAHSRVPTEDDAQSVLLEL